MLTKRRSYEYKYAVFGDLLHEEIYDHLTREHKKKIDTWLSGMLNGWDDVDCVRSGVVIHVSTDTMKAVFLAAEEYCPNIYETLETVIELVEEHFAQDHVRTLDSQSTLKRLEDAFNEWHSLAAARMGA